MDAQLRLAATPGVNHNSDHYGVSYLYDDEILYLAAVERLNKAEPVPPGCSTYVLKSGTYISIYISNFASDVLQIDKAFKQLLAHPGIDENGCCVECYLPDGTTHQFATDIRCMVRLADR